MSVYFQHRLKLRHGNIHTNFCKLFDLWGPYPPALVVTEKSDRTVKVLSVRNWYQYQLFSLLSGILEVTGKIYSRLSQLC